MNANLRINDYVIVTRFDGLVTGKITKIGLEIEVEVTEGLNKRYVYVPAKEAGRRISPQA